MARYRVLEPYQANVGGTVYGPGESFDAKHDEAAKLLEAGIIVHVERESKRSRKPSKG